MAILSLFGGSASKSSQEDQKRESAEHGRGASGPYLTFTLGELREMGCYAASTELGLGECKNKLSSIAAARRTAIEKEHESQSGSLNERLTRIAANIAGATAGLSDSGPPITAGGLRVKVARQDAIVSGLILQAQAAHAETELQERRRTIKEQGEVEREWLDSRIGTANRLLSAALAERTANKAEIDRQAKRLEERSGECQDLLKKERERIAELNDLGITRHVSSFLIWGTSFSAIGCGIAVAQILERALSNAQQRKDDTLLLEWIRRIHSPSELLMLFISFMAVVVAAVAVVAIITTAIRVALRKYDPAWAPAGRSPQPDGELSEWLSLFSLANRIGSRGVNDRSLQQLLGFVPLVVAAGAVGFLLIAFGDRSSGNSSFVASQLGPAFALLSVVAMMLLITNVLGSLRSKKPLSAVQLVFFIAIGIVPMVALGFAALVFPSGSAYGLAAIAVAMLFSSSGLAFGLMYRGHFVREDYLEHEIERVESNIFALRLQPTIAGVLGHIGFGKPLMGKRGAAKLQDYFKTITREVKKAFVPRESKLETAYQQHKEPDGPQLLDDWRTEERLADLRTSSERLKVICEQRTQQLTLRAALGALERLENEEKEARRKLLDVGDTYQTQLRDLTVEEQRTMLELQAAYDIAVATMYRPEPPAMAAAA